MYDRLRSIAHGTRVPWVTLTLSAAIIFIHALPDTFSHMVYDRQAIADDELWRLASGHFTHLDWGHLLTNAAALTGLGWLIESDPHGGRSNLLGVLAAATAMISTLLMLFTPATLFYAGLSGVLNGLFAFACLRLFAQTRHKAWLALLMGAGAKIAWEAAFGPLFTAPLAWPPQSLAHLGGLLAGLGYAITQAIGKARRSWYFPWHHCPLIPV